MKTYINLIVICMLLLKQGAMKAQISEGGTPPSFEMESDSSLPESIPVEIINTGVTTTEAGVLIAGYSTKVDYDIKRLGTLYEQSDGSKIWKIRFQVEEATSLMFLFDEYQVPEGAKLFIYSSNREKVMGAFTSRNNKSYGRLATAPIKGNDIIIEYYVPSSQEEGVLHLSKIGAMFSNSPIQRAFGDAATCNNNVMCPEGDPWCNQRRSVAMIFFINDENDEIPFCSGSLITKEKRDYRPYFLTAFHCLDFDADINMSDEEQNNAMNFVFAFNYQSDQCENSNDEPDLYEFSISGANYRSSNSYSDFALLELSARPPGNFNAYYNGFDNRNTRPAKNGAIIHHPRVDVKKISFYEDQPNRKLINDIKTWEIDYTSGITEGGSSGAPFFGGDKLLVGQHYGAELYSPVCDGGYIFGYAGRFDKSWDYGSNTFNRLQNWLHPTNDGLTTMTGDDPCHFSYDFTNVNDLHTSENVDGSASGIFSWGVHTYNGVYEAVQKITSGENVIIQDTKTVVFNAGQEVHIKEGFHAEQGSVFHAYIEGCLSGCGNGRSAEAPYTLYEKDTSKVDEEENPILKFFDHTFNIYPNPTSGIFYIRPEGDKGMIYQIEITDTLGRVIYTSQENTSKESTIDISGNSNGIYYLKINYAKSTQTKRIVLDSN